MANNMESICNFLEKLFSTKEQEKVKPTPKIQSTAYPDGRIINYKK